MTTTYNAHQAAHICGIHVRTIQRRAEELIDAGAWKDESGEWRIPLQVLRDIGMAPGRPLGGDARTSTGKTQVDDGGMPGRQGDYRDERVRELEEQVHVWQRRAEVAEALAAERREHLETAKQALRALTASPSTPVAPSAAPSVALSPPAPAAPRRSFSRLFRRSPKPPAAEPAAQPA